MLDIKHYAGALQPNEASLIAKFFSKKNFSSLYGAKKYFEEMGEKELSWIQKEEIRNDILQVSKKFAKVLESAEPTLEEKREKVLERCHYSLALFDFLDAKGQRSITCLCPKCGDRKERAFVPANGEATMIICNHRTNCGFKGDYISAFAEHYKLTYGQSMQQLAKELGVDLNFGEAHIEGTKKAPIYKPLKLEPKRIEKKEVDYDKFDINKPYRSVNYGDYLEVYPKMAEKQQFMMIATAIYEFSLQTQQWGKLMYYKDIKISKKNKDLREKLLLIEKKLGYLFKTDIPQLIEFLKERFPIDDLVKYGVLHPKDAKRPYSFKQSVVEGLIVIPNEDIYSNMCTGLKFRKTKLKEWIDDKGERKVDRNKEPEFSFGRIANPVPYNLTREALANPMVSFRFFEGQKDLHSMPSKHLRCDVAIAGVNGISIEMLGFFKGKRVEIFFDQDESGQEGAQNLKKMLEDAGAYPVNKTWNKKIGSDVNEVLQNGYISQLANL